MNEENHFPQKLFLIGSKGTYSYREFNEIFSTDEDCRSYLELKRWGDTPACVHCASLNVHRFLNDKKTFKCREKECRKKFTVTVGTVFENTKIPLSVWFSLLYSMCLNKKNTSSLQMALNMGVTQASIWQATMKIRTLFSDKNPRKLSGVIEIDECYISKQGRWNSWYRGKKKKPVIGMKERGGEVRMFCVQSLDRNLIESLIRGNVEESSTIYTDGCRSYNRLSDWFEHDFVNHKEKEWVGIHDSNVHTNNIEGAWAQLKRIIRGAHHSVSEHHLQKYCDEVTYKMNNIHVPPIDKFNDLLNRAMYRNIKNFSKHFNSL